MSKSKVLDMERITNVLSRVTRGEGVYKMILDDIIDGDYDLPTAQVMGIDVDLREVFAAIAHKQWSGWMEYLFDMSDYNDDGSVLISADNAKRWKKQAQTDYHNLSKKEQDSDRAEADKFLTAIGKQGRRHVVVDVTAPNDTDVVFRVVDMVNRRMYREVYLTRDEAQAKADELDGIVKKEDVWTAYRGEDGAHHYYGTKKGWVGTFKGLTETESRRVLNALNGKEV